MHRKRLRYPQGCSAAQCSLALMNIHTVLNIHIVLDSAMLRLVSWEGGVCSLPNVLALQARTPGYFYTRPNTSSEFWQHTPTVSAPQPNSPQNFWKFSITFLEILHEIWTPDSQEDLWICCHQMSDFKAEMHQIQFWRRLHRGSLQLCSRSRAEFKGPNSKGGKGNGYGMGDEGTEKSGGVNGEG